MSAFFLRELKGDESWPIALSRKDALKYVDRTDHGTTGSYASWPPLSFEAMAKLQSDFTNAVPILLGGASSAREGPFGQSQAVAVVGPPRGAADVPPFKTTIGTTLVCLNLGQNPCSMMLRKEPCAAAGT
jgi:hypothetical protein